MKPNGMHFPFGPFLWQTTLDIDVVDDLLDKTKNTIKYHNDKLAGIIDEEHKFSDEDTSWFANKTSSVIKEYLNLIYFLLTLSYYSYYHLKILNFCLYQRQLK